MHPYQYLCLHFTVLLSWLGWRLLCLASVPFPYGNLLWHCNGSNLWIAIARVFHFPLTLSSLSVSLMWIVASQWVSNSSVPFRALFSVSEGSRVNAQVNVTHWFHSISIILHISVQLLCCSSLEVALATSLPVNFPSHFWIELTTSRCNSVHIFTALPLAIGNAIPEISYHYLFWWPRIHCPFTFQHIL